GGLLHGAVQMLSGELRHSTRVLLRQEMACIREELESSVRDPARQLPPAFGRDPWVELSPRDQRRSGDLAVARFDLTRVPLVPLGDLPVEGSLTLRAEPWRDETVFDLARERPHLRRIDIRTYHALVDCRGKRLEHLAVLPD